MKSEVRHLRAGRGNQHSGWRIVGQGGQRKAGYVRAGNQHSGWRIVGEDGQRKAGYLRAGYQPELTDIWKTLPLRHIHHRQICINQWHINPCPHK